MRVQPYMRQGKEGSLEELLAKVKDFHGHLGPFAALGVKLSLAGLRKLGVKRGDTSLQAVVELPELKTPYTCIVDGVQVATGCTVGNGRLKVVRGENFGFKLKLEGSEIGFKVAREAIEWMENELKAGKPMEEVARRLLDVADSQVFTELG